MDIANNFLLQGEGESSFIVIPLQLNLSKRATLNQKIKSACATFILMEFKVLWPSLNTYETGYQNQLHDTSANIFTYKYPP